MRRQLRYAKWACLVASSLSVGVLITLVFMTHSRPSASSVLDSVEQWRTNEMEAKHQPHLIIKPFREKKPASQRHEKPANQSQAAIRSKERFINQSQKLTDLHMDEKSMRVITMRKDVLVFPIRHVNKFLMTRFGLLRLPANDLYMQNCNSTALCIKRAVQRTFTAYMPLYAKAVCTAFLVQTAKNFLYEACMNYTGPSLDLNLRQAMYSHTYSLYYCPVEKTASTFWRRFFYQLERSDPVQSPFDVQIPVAFGYMGNLRTPKIDNEDDLNELLFSSTKMIFVRDPYSRLFSAFVDKLIPPNPLFWGAWGRPAILHFRKNESSAGKKSAGKLCGGDVTFLEFIREAVTYIYKKDVHVMPIFRLCSPCAIYYDVIGKMETFVSDASVVAKAVGLEPKHLRFDDMEDDARNDAIEDSATDALSIGWLHALHGCTDRYAVARRIWRKLQLRGFISWRRKFPLRKEETAWLTSSDFIRILKKESSMSKDKKELKLQKIQAMREAFSTLTLEEFNAIERIFEMDFRLFGFDSSFYSKVGTLGVDVKNSHSFEWWTDWDLSSVL